MPRIGTASSPDDLAVALWTAYALHYETLDDVDEDQEWNPDLLTLRRELEEELEFRLREEFAGSRDGDLADVLFEMTGDGTAGEKSLVRFVQTRATREQVLELLRLRSLFHLREFDPTAWVVPRLPVRAKAALAELLYDEYGAGNPNRLHHHLFARGMAACGLVPTRGRYVDEAPLEVLDQNNAMSLFGLHRRLRGAAVGHFAAFEATSSAPSRRLVQGMQRLDLPPEIVDYYDTHIAADAVHEQIAVRTICGSLVEDEPHLRGDVLFGAATCLGLEDRVGGWLLDRWDVA
ncbi:MAG: iron-containing redox enzyme family protein [Nocardioides sp.]